MSQFKYTHHLLREWYVGTDVGKLSAMSSVTGLILGFFYGKWAWNRRLQVEVSDTLEITTMKLPFDEKEGAPARLKEFETAWNMYARHAQRMSGYQWTKLYKSRDWNSPADYLQLRLWKDGESYGSFLESENGFPGFDNDVLKQFGITAQKATYTCIIDDTVRRMIEVK